jgi:hypothetical protein
MTEAKVLKEAPVPINVWLPAVVAGWIVPGAGHFLLKKRGRGAMILGSVSLMFLFGLFMRGSLFTPERSDVLTTLITYGGFIGNLANGVLYFLTTWLGYNQPDVAGHVHDYGTKFLVSSGLLNILGMVDAYEIAVGKKD